MSDDILVQLVGIIAGDDFPLPADVEKAKQCVAIIEAPLRAENEKLRAALKDLIEDHEYMTDTDAEEDNMARAAARTALKETGMSDDEYFNEIMAESEEYRAEILRLRAENDKLRAALKPFAVDSLMDDAPTLADYRAARAALKETGMSKKDDVAYSLQTLCHPASEFLADGQRLTLFIKRGNEAASEILRLRAENEKLREATGNLVRSLSGCWYAFEPSLRREMGNTNYHCVKEKMDEVEALLDLRSAAAALKETGDE